ncbi:hypothetical protein AYI70_g6313 [Smittium culicis]|uniref:Uncharacterized protein n=1 Tax=Smittium culicis TaxID=133412 RepID=A0A1R1XQI3_9FUNG|nr:hypothetical protein AYI70_g6313 [Smittium culicis]
MKFQATALIYFPSALSLVMSELSNRESFLNRQSYIQQQQRPILLKSQFRGSSVNSLPKIPERSKAPANINKSNQQPLKKLNSSPNKSDDAYNQENSGSYVYDIYDSDNEEDDDDDDEDKINVNVNVDFSLSPQQLLTFLDHSIPDDSEEHREIGSTDRKASNEHSSSNDHFITGINGYPVPRPGPDPKDPISSQNNKDNTKFSFAVPKVEYYEMFGEDDQEPDYGQYGQNDFDDYDDDDTDSFENYSNQNYDYNGDDYNEVEFDDQLDLDNDYARSNACYSRKPDNFDNISNSPENYLSYEEQIDYYDNIQTPQKCNVASYNDDIDESPVDLEDDEDEDDEDAGFYNDDDEVSGYDVVNDNYLDDEDYSNIASKCNSRQQRSPTADKSYPEKFNIDDDYFNDDEDEYDIQVDQNTADFIFRYNSAINQNRHSYEKVLEETGYQCPGNNQKYKYSEFYEDIDDDEDEYNDNNIRVQEYLDDSYEDQADSYEGDDRDEDEGDNNFINGEYYNRNDDSDYIYEYEEPDYEVYNEHISQKNNVQKNIPKHVLNNQNHNQSGQRDSYKCHSDNNEDFFELQSENSQNFDDSKFEPEFANADYEDYYQVVDNSRKTDPDNFEYDSSQYDDGNYYEDDEYYLHDDSDDDYLIVDDFVYFDANKSNQKSPDRQQNNKQYSDQNSDYNRILNNDFDLEDNILSEMI